MLKIPVRANTPTLAGAWTGEGAAKPVKKASFSTVTLSPTKLSVISTFSEEMATYGMPSIEGIIRQAMSDDTGIALDSYLIDNVAASAGVRPAGLLNGVTPITASAATPATAAMVADLKALVGAITAAGGGGRGPIAILINPAQALVACRLRRPRPATSCSPIRRRPAASSACASSSRPPFRPAG